MIPCFWLSEGLKDKYLKQMEGVLISLVSCEHKVALERQAVKEAKDGALEEVADNPGSTLFDDVNTTYLDDLFLQLVHLYLGLFGLGWLRSLPG